MKQKHNEGFSLVEVLVAMAILATILIGTGSALVTSYRINNKTDDLMQAQLAVSSKVETLMASGIQKEKVESCEDNSVIAYYTDGDVEVRLVEQETAYCKLKFTSTLEESVSVTTNIRKAGG